MPSEKLQVILELVTGNYKREAKAAANATDGIGSSASGVTSKLGAMLGPAAIGGAIVGLVTMAQKAGENADRLFDLASQTGLTTDQLQEYEFVAKTAGASTEVFSDAVKAVIKNLDGTEGATGAAAKAYDALGISVFDAGGKLRDAGAITDEVFVKLADMTNITERNALAQDIFGKKWEETISVLDLGGDAIQRAKDEAHDLGAVISGESLEGADEFRETWEKLKTTLSAKLMETLGKLGPTLTGIAEAVLAVVDAADPLLDLLPKVTEDAEKFFDVDAGGVNVLTLLFGGLSDELDAQLLLWDAQINSVRLFEDAARSSGSAYRGLGDAAIFMADAAKDDAIPAIGRLDTAQRSAGDAARFHHDQVVALTNRLAAALNPALAADQALQDLKQAHEDAGAAADEFGADSEEAARAQLELALKSAIAKQALSEFGVGADSSIRAVATALGITDEQARILLDTLGILDGTVVTIDVALRQTTLLDKGVIPEGLGLTNGTKTTTTSSGAAGYGTGNRAFGGPVSAFKPYVVGERGPELFVSGTSGSIIPNDVMKALGRASGPTINVNHPNTLNLAQDLQLATILASVVNYVETS